VRRLAEQDRFVDITRFAASNAGQGADEETLRDRQEGSQTMVETCKIFEPNFSYELLRDKSFPVSSLHRSRLLEKQPQRQI
jgi:hypothetical protein